MGEGGWIWAGPIPKKIRCTECNPNAMRLKSYATPDSVGFYCHLILYRKVSIQEEALSFFFAPFSVLWPQLLKKEGGGVGPK